MKTIVIVYVADGFHSVNSTEVIGVATSKHEAIKLLKAEVKRNPDYDPLDSDDLKNLEDINQTQGREDNFRIEEFNLNEIKL